MPVLETSQFNQLVAEIREVLLANSQGVGEVEQVSSLDNIVSLPALRLVGESETVVVAPISLLSIPAIEAAAAAHSATEDAIVAVVDAIAAARQADGARVDLEDLKEQVTFAIQKAYEEATNALIAAQATEEITEVAKEAIKETVTAIENANDTAGHPTKIGEDNYVYAWNKEAKEYEKTTILVKGDAGASMNLLGRFDTLAGLTSTYPDGKDENGKEFNGMFAIGIQIPYSYYAFYDSAWNNQGELKGDPFTFDDFTPEQLIWLRKPATDAEEGAKNAAAAAAKAAEEANTAAESANIAAEGARIVSDTTLFIPPFTEWDDIEPDDITNQIGDVTNQIKNAVEQTQSGTTYSDYGWTTQYFDKPFADIPSVVCTLVDPSYEKTIIKIKNITKESFQVYTAYWNEDYEDDKYWDTIRETFTYVAHSKK